MYAVCVTFELKPGLAARFMPLMQANAQLSLQTEYGCRQFDVLTDSATPDAVFLYELYSDRAAFDLHLGSAHFKAFDSAVADMIATKTVRTWDAVMQ